MGPGTLGGALGVWSRAMGRCTSGGRLPPCECAAPRSAGQRTGSLRPLFCDAYAASLIWATRRP